MALAEHGTHVLWWSVIDKYSQVEQTLLKDLSAHLQKGTLVLMDRDLLSFGVTKEVSRREAYLLIRYKSNRVLLFIKRQRDGSYLSHVYRTYYDRISNFKGIDVRVIEYTTD